MTFISIRGRVLLNAEAMNMTESVGNYVKHRRVPVVLPETHATFFVPAISGESIAHGFQSVLAETAKSQGLPVCALCSKGIFLKSTNSSVVRFAFSEKIGQDISKWLGLENLDEKEEEEIAHALEKAVIRDCVVEDVGGFLYAEQRFEGKEIGGVKRTSNFYTGYMIPVRETLESTVIEPQLHSRYALGTHFVREQRGQMIYYVELSSSSYTFSLDLDTRYIGKTTFVLGKEEEVDKRTERISATLESLQGFLIEFMFGAKKTRFLPIVDWESLVIAISDRPWTVPSPLSASYVLNALTKLEKLGNGTKLFIYINPIMFEETTAYIKRKTEELLNTFYQALEEFKEALKKRGDDKLIDWENFKKRRLEKFLEERVEEVTKASDLKYIPVVREKYAKAKQKIEKMKEEKKKEVPLFENFENCVKEAIGEAKPKA